MSGYVNLYPGQHDREEGFDEAWEQRGEEPDVLTTTDAEELTEIIDRLTSLYGLSRVSPTVKPLQALADRAAAAKKGPRE